MSGEVRVVPFRLPLIEAAVTGDAALAEAVGYEVAVGWMSFPAALVSARDALAANPEGVEWGPRLFIGDEPPTVIGWGGFKGPPTAGEVELGYEIAPTHRGRGLATAAARAMILEAFADPVVTTVTAHTQPEPNASNHILEKLGFHYEGERLDDSDPVWRYVLERPISTAP
jgi:ribosomal-protein-alanine N-acetyltransferase